MSAKHLFSLTITFALCFSLHGQVIYVTSTTDNASSSTTSGTLRYAITQVNLGNYNEIRFNFPSAGPHVITLNAALPVVQFPNGTTTITIDGNNTHSSYPGPHQVVIDGGNQNIDGINVKSGYTPVFFTLKNLVLTGFGDPYDTGPGIYAALRDQSGHSSSVAPHYKIQSNGSLIDNNVIINSKYGMYYLFGADIVNNYIGVDQNLSPAPNRYGYFSENNFSSPFIIGYSTYCRIGLPGQGNYICSNIKDGIYMQAGHNEIYANYIGTDQFGNDLGNGGCGIRLTDQFETARLFNNWIGDHDYNSCTAIPAAANHIAHNGEDGIYIYCWDQNAGTGNSFINQNIIHSNGNKAINLNLGSSPPPYPGNQAIPAPVIVNYDATAGTADGTVNASVEPGSIIEVFKSDAAGDALKYLGCTTTDASFNWSIAGLNTTGVNYIVTTVTEKSTNSLLTHRTSELSEEYYSMDCSQYNLSAAFQMSPSNPTVNQNATLTYTGIGSNVYSYTIDWGDGSSTNGSNISNGAQLSHVYASVGTYVITMTVYGPDPCQTSNTVIIEVMECCTGNMALNTSLGEQLGNTGQFFFDNQTGKLIYQKSDCPTDYEFQCLLKQIKANNVSGVLDVSMLTMSDNWGYYYNYYLPSSSWSSDPFENGAAGKWRVKAEYYYKSDLDEALLAQLGGNSANSVDYYKNFDRGTFSIDMFDWDYPENNDPNKWVKGSDVLFRTPNGFVDEDRNLRGTYSMAQYGYDNKLLVAVVNRAQRHGASFESYERTYADGSSQRLENYTILETGTSAISSSKAHSGEQSLKLLSDVSADGASLGRLQMDVQLVRYGVLIRVWVWIDPDKPEFDASSSYRMRTSIKREHCNSCNWQNPTKYFEKVTQVGEWALYEVLLDETDINTTTITTANVTQGYQFLEVQVVVEGWGGTGYATGDIYIDDVRMGPRNGIYQCYVYDSSERIVASFDDQHMGLFYQYNAEGSLIRKRKETARGLKTISETNYNAQGQNKY